VRVVGGKGEKVFVRELSQVVLMERVMIKINVIGASVIQKPSQLQCSIVNISVIIRHHWGLVGWPILSFALARLILSSASGEEECVSVCVYVCMSVSEY